MGHSAHGGKSLVQNEVRRKIGGRTKGAFDNISLQIHDNHVFCLHRFISNAAWFDNYQPFVARNSAGVSEGVENQASPHQLEIRMQNFFAQRLKFHIAPRAAAAILRNAGRTPPACTGLEFAWPKPKYNSR